jgi:osmotically-inducible protein OsmY
MSRYEDRDYDRGQRDYGRRSESDYDRSYGERYQGRYGSGRDENERESYGGESRSRGQYGSGQYSGGSQYGGGSRSRSRGEYRSGREGYRPGSENDLDYSDERESRYGNFMRGYDTGSYDDTSSGYSQRYNYPTGFRSGESYGDRGRSYDYDRDRYDRGGEERGWWDRASDAVASWFGDEEAERRRRMDQQREHRRGRGPKGYRRSDERIKEDVNDRLSDDYYIDASDVEVSVQNQEVTLTGTVTSREDKRRAEDIAESVSGVTNVENRLRVKQRGYGDYSTTGTGSSTGAGTGSSTGTGVSSGTTGITGTPGSTTSSAAAGGGKTSNT